jgi:hypothetical protein
VGVSTAAERPTRSKRAAIAASITARSRKIPARIAFARAIHLASSRCTLISGSGKVSIFRPEARCPPRRWLTLTKHVKGGNSRSSWAAWLIISWVV